MRLGDPVAWCIVALAVVTLARAIWLDVRAARRRRDAKQLGLGGRGVRR